MKTLSQSEMYAIMGGRRTTIIGEPDVPLRSAPNGDITEIPEEAAPL